MFLSYLPFIKIKRQRKKNAEEYPSKQLTKGNRKIKTTYSTTLKMKRTQTHTKKRRRKTIARKYHSTQFVQEQMLIIVDGQRGNCFSCTAFLIFRIYLHRSRLYYPGRSIFNNFSLSLALAFTAVHTHTYQSKIVYRKFTLCPMLRCADCGISNFVLHRPM